MSPDWSVGPHWSVCATGLTTTLGEKSSTKPFMYTTANPDSRTQVEADRNGGGGVDHPVVLPRSRGGIFCRYRPGEGNGTAFQAQDGAFDSEVESILPKDLNVTGLSVGPHLVGVRYQDNNNTWGEVLYQTIHVYDANPSGSGSGGPVVVEVVVIRWVCHDYRQRNILLILIRAQAAAPLFRQRTGRLIPRSNPSCPRI